MNHQKETGNKGEDLAVSLLSQKGYKILERNWRFGHLEIDIIAKNEDTLVFIEVKSRSSNYLVEPELSISKKQQKFIIKAANAFIDSHDYDIEARFDIISIVFTEEKSDIKHIEDAFYPYAN